MPRTPEDYFHYFALPEDLETWGIAVTAAGFTRIGPDEDYPPRHHPADHDFAWRSGRVIEATQVVLIAEGRGRLESTESGVHDIEEGTAFLLFPGVWHRYRPDPSSGWVESWVEVRGPTVDRLLRRKVFDPRRPVLRTQSSTNLEVALDAIHARSRRPVSGFDTELAARGLAVLASCEQAAAAPARSTRVARAVAKAERHLSQNLSEPVDIAALAEDLGVAYTRFRTSFKAITGYSPWQYVIHLRLQQVRRLLTSTDASLEEIAAFAGFSSAFHLSSTFKQSFGVAPARWRQLALAKAPRP